MKVILIKDVKKTGKKDEILDVKDGYGSYLINNKLAVLYTNKSQEILKTEIQDRKETEQKEIENARIIKDKLTKISITFKVKTGKDGKVFGSISNKQICEELKNKGFDIDKKKIKIINDIKTLGTHIVKIELHKQIIADLKVTLEGEINGKNWTK